MSAAKAGVLEAAGIERYVEDLDLGLLTIMENKLGGTLRTHARGFIFKRQVEEVTESEPTIRRTAMGEVVPLDSR